MASPELAGKNVLVTGGGRGIGSATCRQFAAQGARVFIHYRESKESAEALARELGGQAIHADLTKSSEVKELALAVLKKTGGTLDVLVNNAGTIDRVDSWKDVTEEMWDAMLETNLKSVFLATTAFADALSNGSDSSIVNISSTAHFQGTYPAAHYNASKAGVIALTKSFAHQLAPKVRVNCVAPGYIKTNFQQVMTAGEQEKLLAGIPLGQFGEPDDVARVVVALASEQFRYVTGQTLVVDGGRIMIP